LRALERTLPASPVGKQVLQRALYTGEMNIRQVLLPLLVTCALGLGTAQSLAERSPLPRASLGPVTGEVIVKFRADAGTTRRHALAAGLDSTTVQSRLTARAAELGARTGSTLAAGSAVGDRAQVVRATGMDSATLARQLAADPEVAYAVPNGRKRVLAAPNDPFYLQGPSVNLNAQTGGPISGQWYLRAPDDTLRSAIGIEAAWSRTLGSSDVVVAVLDTGVRFEHPDLGRASAGGPLLPGYDFVNDAEIANDGSGRDADPSDPGDWTTAAENNNVSGLFHACGPFDPASGRYQATTSSWHGTITASLVGARTNNSVGMAGAAPGVKVLPLRVLGKCFGYDSDIIAAMRWAAGIPIDGVLDNPNPAQVINMSLGGEGSCSAAYQDAINEILARNVTIVAAAGNSAGAPVGTPANCTGVIAVLALRHAGTKVGFSDLGPEIAIAAPGGNCINIGAGEPCLYPILAATNAGARSPEGSTWTDAFNASVGTSFSSPLVAGVAALMVSARPSITPAQLRTGLRDTARPFPTTGADNGPDDPTPVRQCSAPSSATAQLQCYCNTQHCGAGMLDAGAAVAAAAALGGPSPRIDVTTTTPTAGAPVTISGAGSSVGSGTTLQSYAWTLVDGGGIVSGFATAENADTVSLTPSAAGNFTVRLTITDNAGASASATRLVAVAAASVVVNPPSSTNGTDTSGGGGAASLWWVLGVLAAALALLHDRWRRGRQAASGAG
jgi:serine protease